VSGENHDGAMEGRVPKMGAKTLNEKVRLCEESLAKEYAKHNRKLDAVITAIVPTAPFNVSTAAR
jgi:hypothetical protein